jgi:hypothetical protein
MKKALLSIVFTSLLYSSNAQTFEWAKNLPSLSDFPGSLSIKSAAEEGSAVYGVYNSNASSTAIGTFLYRVNAAGDLNWIDTITLRHPQYGGISCAGMEILHSGSVITGGNYSDTIYTQDSMIVKRGASDSYLAMYNNSGNIQWMRTIANTHVSDICKDASENLYVLLDFSGNISFLGQNFSSAGTSDMLVAKIDTLGNLLYTRQIHGNINSRKVRVSPAGNVCAFGAFSDTLYYDTLHVSPGIYEVVFGCLRLSPAGDLIAYSYLENYSTAGGPAVFFTDAEINYQERIASSTGFTWTWGTAADINFTGANGAIEHGSQFEADYGGSYTIGGMVQADTTGIWIFGQKTEGPPYSNMLELFKIDYNGNISDSSTFDLSMNNSSTKDIGADQNGDLYITGVYSDSVRFGAHTLHAAGPQAIFIAKIGSAQSTGFTSPAPSTEVSVYPNPSAGIFTVQFKDSKNKATVYVRNLLGEAICFQTIVSGFTSIDLSSQPKGIYFIEVSEGNDRKVKKIILQ